ncbi:MAG TPA: DUF4340 domain-containing protein [Bryobacteraceae bacterium]|nr:hypothetical protein [Bryobacterales bacterium]HRJ18215.1 DUF4340 domain-containing protein [Bryobacteraceae bacterium]
MPLKRLLSAVVALLIAAGLVWWSREKGAPGDDAPAGPKLLDLAENKLRKIELRRAGGETTVLERGADDQWSLTSPAAFRADRDAVQTLVTALSKLNAEKIVEEKVDDFTEFGLREPAFIALVTMDDGTLHTVMLGDEVPAAGGQYARLAGDPRLFTIAAFTKTNLDKSTIDLRDRRLLTFDSTALQTVELRSRGQSVEFARKDAGNWRISKPEPLRADGWQVEELVRRLREAQLDPAQSPDDARKLAAEFNRAAVIAVIAVIAVNDSTNSQQSLEVRRTADNRYLARSSAVEGVHLLSNDTGEGFDKSIADFRSRKLFDFGFAEPSKVEFKDAKGVRVFTKDAAAWKEGPKTVDSVGVQSLIDRLRDLTAEGFPASGFTTPEIEVSITAGKPATTEKILVSRAGERFIARRDGEPALYELKAEAVNEMAQAARDIKEPPPTEKK